MQIVKTIDNAYNVIVEKSDIWNVNMTLAQIIYPVLKAFAENHGGIPHEFIKTFSSNPFELSESENNRISLAWYRILLGMSKAFELIATSKYIDEDGSELPEVKSGLENFSKYYNCLWG